MAIRRAGIELLARKPTDGPERRPQDSSGFLRRGKSHGCVDRGATDLDDCQSFPYVDTGLRFAFKEQSRSSRSPIARGTPKTAASASMTTVRSRRPPTLGDPRCTAESRLEGASRLRYRTTHSHGQRQVQAPARFRTTSPAVRAGKSATLTDTPMLPYDRRRVCGSPQQSGPPDSLMRRDAPDLSIPQLLLPRIQCPPIVDG